MQKKTIFLSIFERGKSLIYTQVNNNLTDIGGKHFNDLYSVYLIMEIFISGQNSIAVTGVEIMV